MFEVENPCNLVEIIHYNESTAYSNDYPRIPDIIIVLNYIFQIFLDFTLICSNID